MFESPWVAVFGRAHLLILHFPIALLLIGAMLEFFQFKGKRDGPRTSAAGVTCVVAGCLFAWLAGATGWIYASRDLGEGLWESGFFDGDGLDWHRWTAVVTGVLCLPLLTLAIVSRSCYAGSIAGAYRILLALSAIGVALTGHLGGELIHGKNFLLAPLSQPAQPDEPSTETDPQSEAPPNETEQPDDPEAPPRPTDPDRISFAVVAEILGANCVRCHGPERDRGGIRLATLEEVQEVIDPGFPESSLLVEVIRLPEDDPLHMPKNKPSLPEEQIQTLERWIKQLGEQEQAASIASPPEQSQIAPPQQPEASAPEATAGPTSQRTFTDAELQARDQALRELQSRGALARRISERTQDVEVRILEQREEFGDDDARLLVPLREFITTLDLTGAGITDAALESVGQLHRLHSLRIGETAIGDAGLAHLAELANLERLDLHQTSVTNGGVRQLFELPRLQTLHLWETRVDAGALGDTPARLSITGLQ